MKYSVGTLLLVGAIIFAFLHEKGTISLDQLSGSVVNGDEPLAKTVVEEDNQQTPYYALPPLTSEYVPPGVEFNPEAHDLHPLAGNMYFGVGKPSARDRALYDQYHVEPYNMIVGRVCAQHIEAMEFENAPTEYVEHTTCEYHRERDPHPYMGLDDETLVEVAEHDAMAALVLAKREEGVTGQYDPKWLLVAVALSGKPGPLLLMAERQYTELHSRGAIPGAVVTNYQLKALQQRFVLNEVAGRMGDPRAKAEFWREQLRVVDPDALGEAIALVNTTLTQLGETQFAAKGVNQFEPLIEMGGVDG